MYFHLYADFCWDHGFENTEYIHTYIYIHLLCTYTCVFLQHIHLKALEQQVSAGLLNSHAGHQLKQGYSNDLYWDYYFLHVH